MKKTTGLILFILFFSNALSVVYAQTPADQNFDTQPTDETYSNTSTDIGGVRYTGGPSSNRYASVVDAVSVSPNAAFSGRAILIGNNSSELGGYGEFYTIDNSTNFKLVSLNIETYPQSAEYATEYTVLGYDNGVQKVAVDVNVLSAGTYGSGNDAIVYSNFYSSDEDDDKSGLLTFGSSWENIDQVRFLMKAPSTGYYYIGLDNIDFEDPVVSASENCSLVSVSDQVGDGYNYYSQSFTACQSGKINSIKLLSNATSSSYPVSTVKMTFRSGDGLTGSVLEEIDFSTNLFYVAQSLDDYVVFDVSAHNLEVTLGNQYTFGFEGAPDNQVQIYYSNNEPVESIYDGGNLYFNGLPELSRDLIFEMEFGPSSSVLVPSLTTDAASAITASGATLNGNVTSDGGAIVTARGFVYSSSDNTPTIGETNVTNVPDGDGTGVFSEGISGLNSSTTYYYQAYATNSEGTSYGGVMSFTISSPQLENFSWSADNLIAGATGVTYTFEYTTVTDLGGFDAILYALNTANGWNTNSVTVGDITVLVNGTSRTVAGIYSVSGSGAFITLDNPIVTGGSEVIVTIDNVANNVNPGTYNWNWIYTATSGGNQIDPAVSPNPIVLSANNAPTVTTATASNVTTTTATLGGNVTDNGGATVTERGIVYNTTGTPNINDDTKVQIGSGDGSFSDEIIGLTAGTTYYVRAYATNTAGTSYGGEESFITSTLGLEEELLKNSIGLYPNPVNDLLYLSSNIKVERVSLFDVLGKRINNIKIENDAINLSNIKIGIYLLKIETDKGSLVKRIVKK